MGQEGIEKDLDKPLMRNLGEFSLVGRVGLHAQTGREHELAHCSGETGEKGVEGLLFRISIFIAMFFIQRCGAFFSSFATRV